MKHQQQRVDTYGSASLCGDSCARRGERRTDGTIDELSHQIDSSAFELCRIGALGIDGPSRIRCLGAERCGRREAAGPRRIGVKGAAQLQENGRELLMRGSGMCSGS